jgi:hypothetical protein
MSLIIHSLAALVNNETEIGPNVQTRLDQFSR